uniref:DNA-directed RNA polymerase subunit alpha n=2 Tax=Pavlovaceae TaxID=418969 RepID=M1K3T3_DIALT|nr:RNA polymerase subunit alpha [Diacronema lutheri]YP_009863789.1 RNA polymerase subunit alpha [Pavlova sp. NIVA-4/92]AGE93766.1 RNA polymerase subunit alpha [Diacronema lutheri]QKE31120.1 RNA polymerase subunit alpha [Pavlova sp. NIVA-4/92]
MLDTESSNSPVQLNIESLESKCHCPRSLYEKFTIYPLGKNQGTTIGNALRRVLLSDIEGFAFVGVRFGSAKHAFATIPGVKEDVLDILLNIKQIVIKASEESIQPAQMVARIHVVGPEIVTSNLIKLPPGIEIVDKDQYIATVCNNEKLEIELLIQKNNGYKLSDEIKIEESFEDYIGIDACFTPIVKANFEVEKILLEKGETKEKINLEIYTNGSISPEGSLKKSTFILKNIFESLTAKSILKSEVFEEESENEVVEETLIEEIPISVRAYNCLKRAQINTINDLVNYSREELLEIKNFGRKSVDEVISALEERFNIKLNDEK